MGEAAKNPLATLDIFAGCGGLSAGLKESGNSSLLLHLNLCDVFNFI